MKMRKTDTKWALVITAASTFTMFLEVGIIKGFSVLLPTLKEQFATQTWIIGSSISIIYGWGYTIGKWMTRDEKTFSIIKI